ncbi:head maturation protease, ClpP-related [Sporosarcina sp. FSL K6-1522]|uniref:head maturation protease, ClpP-related n=1 Tax=Sporosarcina sp. FSL K6-1522 TaxID=2921554 RepID=UPI00315A67FD
MTKIHVKGAIVSDAHQRFYDWIGIDATSPSKVSNALPSDKSNVDVVINSGGGDVFAGSEIYTTLRDYEGQVTVKIVGLAASAASVIAMAASQGKLLISPTAQLMMHNVSTYGGGDYRDFEHTAEVLKSANKSIANAYKARTGKSDEELKAVMDKETWLNANSAVEQGFADEIMFAEKEELSLTASFGSPMLSGDAIEKILSMMGEPEEVKHENVLLAEANFRLLKLKGIN